MGLLTALVVLWLQDAAEAQDGGAGRTGMQQTSAGASLVLPLSVGGVPAGPALHMRSFLRHPPPPPSPTQILLTKSPNFDEIIAAEQAAAAAGEAPAEDEGEHAEGEEAEAAAAE